MNKPSLTPDKWRLLLPFLLLTLLLILGLAACGDTSTPAASDENNSPPNQTANLNSGGDTSGPSATAAPQRSSQSKSETSAGGSTDSMMVAPSPDTLYQWLGAIVVSELRGVEFHSSTCGDTWALAFASPEVESKAVNSAGLKVILWGKISAAAMSPQDGSTDSPDSPVVSSAPMAAISVEAVYLADEPMPKIYVPDYPCASDTIDQMYSWIGAIVVSDLEGHHLELDRGCDSWVLLPESDDVAKKLEASVGQKIVIWGHVSRDPSIYMRQTIKVSSAHLPGDPVPAIYIPDYPCPGAVTPDPIDPGPVYSGVDLQLGELAAVGKIVPSGDAIYLETPAGKILLKGDAVDSWVASGGALDINNGTSPCCSCQAPRPPKEYDGEVIVAGKWEVSGGSLVIHARYVALYMHYEYRCIDPVPPTEPPPPPTDDLGVIYGQVRIGPLCPVEPCPNTTPNPYEQHSLILQLADGGDPFKIPLTPDGWFKWQLKAGTYIVNLTDCNYMGCKSALPVKVEIRPGEVTQLEIDIDTGIR